MHERELEMERGLREVLKDIFTKYYIKFTRFYEKRALESYTVAL